jgi:hypothetical protein
MKGSASGFALRYMLDVRGQAHPGVLAFFVDRDGRCRKVRFCECADRDGCETLSAFTGVVHRGAANRTEVERSLAAFVAHAEILVRLTAELDAFSAQACLGTEDAASSSLACQTVADPDANRVVARCCGKLATAARSDSCTHRALRGSCQIHVHSDPDVVDGSSLAALMPRVYHPSRLDQQKFDLAFRIGFVLDAFRNYEHLSG